MLKRFEVWTMGAMVPMILAGCAATAPTTAPAAPAAQPQQTVKASFTTQGGAQGPAQLEAAPNPCGECPASIPYSVTPFGLLNLEQLTANPILDYSWYYARGNFADFGWAPGFYAQLQNFMWYPTAYGSYWPYAYNPGAGAYLPYSTIYGGATVYPYLSGLMQGSYAGMEQHRGGMDRDYGGQGGGQHQGGWGQGGGQGMGQGGGY